MMPQTKSYRVTCLKCSHSNIARITQKSATEYICDLDTDHRLNPDSIHIISARYRKDMQWGWQCNCGQTSLLARQELPEIRDLVIGGGEPAVLELARSLSVEDDKKFRMEQI